MSPPIFINDCHKLHIRALFKSRHHQQGALPLCNVPFRTYLAENGFWLEIPGLGRWEIVGQPIGNDVGGYSEGWRRPQWGAFLYVVGRDGRRCKFLLITPDLKRAGTRWELSACWRSQWVKSKKRRIESRARMLHQLGILHRPENLSLVFVPYVRAKFQRTTTYENAHDPNFNTSANPNVVLVKKPRNMKMRKFYLLLNRLNRTRGRKPPTPSKPLSIYPVRKHHESIRTEELLEKMRRARAY